MEPVLLEKLIIKACMIDTNLLATMSSTFDKDYFDNFTASKIYSYIKDKFIKYKKIPPKVEILSELDKENKDTEELFREIESIDYDVVRNYESLFDSINNYLKEKAIKKAILSSVDIINQKNDLSEIRKVIEDALSKDLKINLGIDYFGTLKERLIRVLTTSDVRIPTYFPSLDEYLNGGFPPYTLSIFLARIHGMKSSFLANMASRQVLHGKNVILASLEMSEDAFAQRFDALFSLYDINAIYRDKPVKKKLLKKLNEIKQIPNRGNLFIKDFPTGKATVGDFRKYIRELTIRGNYPDIFICDYINLMKPEYKTKGEMYNDVKTISEELRAMSFEFKIPVVSVSQLNREGMNLPFEEVDFTSISESIGVAATGDLLTIFGSHESQAVYESELFYKIVKNRLGGRVGEINKFYFDQRNLKLYDSLELEKWLDDANISGDTRKMAEIIDRAEHMRGSRTRRNRER